MSDTPKKKRSRSAKRRPKDSGKAPQNPWGKSLSARAEAAKLLMEVESGHSLQKAMPIALARLQPNHTALMQELVYGSLREWPRLNAIANALISKPLKSKDGDVKALIMLGLHQLSAMRVPAHAAISETVAACRELDKSWAAGFINGVLRNFQREQDALERGLDAAATLALPHWFYLKLRSQWPEQLGDIAVASRTHPPMTLRVNGLRGSRDEYLARLAEADISAKPCSISPWGLTLESPMDVGSLPGFAEGLVSVQDESAQLAGQFLAPLEGEHILDACAAPGGKACHLLEMTPNIGSLIAMDNSHARIGKIAQNCERLGLSMTLLHDDAIAPSATLSKQRFDVIAVDAPCSATGVIRRNPDIKVHRKDEDIASFAEQQKEILSGVWPLLKPGGRLLYITCSILDEENDHVVAWALENLPDIEARALNCDHLITTTFGLQTLPSAQGGDGLYFALVGKAL